MMLNIENASRLEQRRDQNFDLARKLRARIGELPGNIPLEGLAVYKNRSLHAKFPGIHIWTEAMTQPDMIGFNHQIISAIAAIVRDQPKRANEIALVTVDDLRKAPDDRILGIRHIGPLILRVLEIIFK